jgi:hypothetical protein
MFHMKEEMVHLSNIEEEKLILQIKEHFKELGLQIIHEDKHANYWSIKAYKGGALAAITGSIRDIEIMMSGSGDSHDLILRTGAWGRDIAIPALLASAVSFGAGAIVAGAEAYRAHKFEKNFWEWLNQSIGSFNATMTPPSPAGRVCIKCSSHIPTDAKFCMHCGAHQS